MSQSSHPRESRHRRHANLRAGRIQLVILFIVMEALDVTLYLCSTERFREIMLGGGIVWTIWSVACGIGMWKRQGWMRYLLIFRLLASVLVNGALELGHGDAMYLTYTPKTMFLAVGVTLGHLIVAIILIASPSIYRLTNPDPYSNYR